VDDLRTLSLPTQANFPFNPNASNPIASCVKWQPYSNTAPNRKTSPSHWTPLRLSLRSKWIPDE
jgi:hypothetical protein